MRMRERETQQRSFLRLSIFFLCGHEPNEFDNAVCWNLKINNIIPLLANACTQVHRLSEPKLGERMGSTPDRKTVGLGSQIV